MQRNGQDLASGQRDFKMKPPQALTSTVLPCLPLPSHLHSQTPPSPFDAFLGEILGGEAGRQHGSAAGEVTSTRCLCYFCSAQGKEPQPTGSLPSQSWDVN